MISDLPDVSQETLDHHYKAMGQMEVHLDSDPLALGPKRMNGKFAMIRTHLSNVERIFTEVSHNLAIYKRRLRMKTAEHAVRRNDLLANDPETRAGRSVADREAVVYVKLKDLIDEIDLLDCGVIVLDLLLIVVKSKKADLKDIQNRLRDQFKVCQEEIHLGTQWGVIDEDDRNEHFSVNLNPGQDYSSNLLDDIEDLLGPGVPGEIHVERSSTATIKKRELVTTSTPDDVEGFFDNLDDPTMFAAPVLGKSTKDIDLEALMDDLDSEDI